METSELDTRLIEQLSRLGTNDQEDLVEKFRSYIGTNITVESAKFFLEIGGWNLSKALGAYFDFSFEVKPNLNQNNQIAESSQLAENNGNIISFGYSPDLSVVYNTNLLFSSNSNIVLSLKNSGTCQWKPGSYVKSTVLNLDSLLTVYPNSENPVWLPIGMTNFLPLVLVPPGHQEIFEVCLHSPPSDVVEYMKKNKTSVVGGLSFCTPEGQVFGETLYVTVMIDSDNDSLLFCQGPHFMNATNNESSFNDEMDLN